VVPACSDKELVEANVKGFGLLTELAKASFLFSQHVASAFITVPAHGRWRAVSGYGGTGGPAGGRAQGDRKSLDAVRTSRRGWRRGRPGCRVSEGRAGVWLRLYQQQMHGLVPAGPSDPLWWTLRRPFLPLSYPAARAMFTRANQVLGSNWTLHDLRHSASYRMARDPQVELADVQWVLGHAHMSTTELYLNKLSGIASDGRETAGQRTSAILILPVQEHFLIQAHRSGTQPS
jgi:hypothetical protein